MRMKIFILKIILFYFSFLGLKLKGFSQYSFAPEYLPEFSIICKKILLNVAQKSWKGSSSAPFNYDFNETISKAPCDPRLQVDFGRYGGQAQLSLAA